jgi:hypothetical protein
MTVSRRSLILAAGGGLALAGAGAFFRVTRAPKSAAKPWSLEPTPSVDVRLDAFRHAILAPNPHNRQPWLIQLAGQDEALIFCDLARRLPQTDPFDRQITIGFGCFLALAEMAAQARGYRMDVLPFPLGSQGPRLDNRPIARLRFTPVPDMKADPIFAAILQRRSVKQPFDMARAIPQSIMDALSRAAGSEVAFGRSAGAGTSQAQALRNITWKAWKIEAETARTWQETVDLMRIGAGEVDAEPDGVSLKGPLIEALSAVGQISRKALADTTSSAYRIGYQRYETMLAASPAYIWIATSGNSREEQLAAGRAYVRANLAATLADLSMHPVSQALQEYQEMAAVRSEVHALLGKNNVQMLARIGYGTVPEPTPRWPLEAKLIS